MASLLDRIKGTEELSEELPEELPEIPDEIPSDWESADAPFAADPVPAGKASRTPAAPATYPRVTATMQRKIAEQISMYIDLLAMPVALRDPVCGGAVQDQADALGKAFAKILARYPEAAHRMLQSGVLGDWIAVLLAAKPIGEAIWNHHIVKTEEVPADEFADFDTYRPGQ